MLCPDGARARIEAGKGDRMKTVIGLFDEFQEAQLAIRRQGGERVGAPRMFPAA